MTIENEQYESKPSFYHLEICCRYVGERYGNAIITSWTNGDYIKLSSILSRQTDVQLSPSTLKRIFGKLKTTERYYPQKATRDALAHFAGFKDWDTFVLKHPKSVKQEDKKVELTEKTTEDAELPRVKQIIKKRNWLPVILMASVLVILIMVWQYTKKEKPAVINTKGIQFSCNNPEGENPHSATFRIQLPPNFSGDTTNFRVDFGDGRLEKKVTTGTFTHYYEIPGRYYAVLKYNNAPIDTVSLYLKTNGWTATAVMEHDSTRVYPVTNSRLFNDGNLVVRGNELLRAGVDTNRTFFVHFANTKPLNISGDNFELTANVTTSQQRPGVRCSQVNLEIYGENSRHAAILIKPGCVSWAYLRFSEFFKGGETDDLSSIGTDLSNGGVIKLRVINKKVTLLINDKQAYATAYDFPLNKIYGVKIAFSGIGTVHDLEIKDLTSGEIFREGFASKFGK